MADEPTDWFLEAGRAHTKCMLLTAEIERLRVALAPFATIAAFTVETQRDSRPLIFGMDNVILQRLTIGHLRAARAALSPAERQP